MTFNDDFPISSNDILSLNELTPMIIPGTLKPGLVAGLLLSTFTTLVFSISQLSTVERLSRLWQIAAAPLTCVSFGVPFTLVSLLWERLSRPGITLSRGAFYHSTLILLSCSSMAMCIVLGCSRKRASEETGHGSAIARHQRLYAE
jgi:hypothetical protein